jgi:hypothetical protein
MNRSFVYSDLYPIIARRLKRGVPLSHYYSHCRRNRVLVILSYQSRGFQ